MSTARVPRKYLVSTARVPRVLTGGLAQLYNAFATGSAARAADAARGACVSTPEYPNRSVSTGLRVLPVSCWTGTALARHGAGPAGRHWPGREC